MDYEFRALDLDYEKLSEYCIKVREKLVEVENEDQEGEGYDVPFTKYMFAWAENNSEFAIGAYDGEKLVGTIMAIVEDVIINDPKQEIKGIKLNAGFLCNLSVAAELWPGLELKQKLISLLLDKLKEANIDVVITNPLNDKNSEVIEYMKSIGFLIKNKDVQANIKMMGKDAVNHIKIAEGLNAVLVQAAKLLAGWKSDGISEGQIRDVKEADYPKIVEMLNDYTETNQIAIEWKIEDIKGFIKNIENLNDHRTIHVKDKFPDSAYGTHLKVWEIDGEVKAHVFFALIEVHLQHLHLPLILWENSSFSKDLTKQQKIDFISQILREHEHKAMVCNLKIPYFEMKAFDKSGFMGDRRTRKFLVKSLTEKGKVLENIKKIKSFLIHSFNFST